MQSKILAWVFGILLGVSIVFGGKNLYDKYKLNQAYSQLNEQLMQAELDVGKAHTQFGNAQDEIKKLNKQLQSLIKKNKEILVMYGELELKYEAEVSSNSTSDPGDNISDPVEPGQEYEPGAWYVAETAKQLYELLNIEIRHRDFRIDINSSASPTGDMNTYDTKTNYKLHMRFGGQLIQSIAPSGATNHYFNLYELDDKGKKVRELQLDKFDVIVQKPKDKKFYWWAPHLDLGVFLGAGSDIKFDSGATVGVSFMGYGYTKNDLAFKFLRAGFDLSDQSIGISLSPVMYNLANNLPLVSNLWISPYLSASSDGTKSGGLQLTVGL